MNEISNRAGCLLASGRVRSEGDIEEAGNGEEESPFGGAEGAAEVVTSAAFGWNWRADLVKRG